MFSTQLSYFNLSLKLSCNLGDFMFFFANSLSYQVRGVSRGESDLALRRESKSENYEKTILHVPCVVGRGGEECLLPDTVSEIRRRRAKEIPGNKDI